MSDWVACGQPHAGFWELTWREVDAVLRGALRRAERAHNARAWAAWHSAALTRVRKFPPLEKLMVGQAPARRQSPREIQAAVEMWMAKG